MYLRRDSYCLLFLSCRVSSSSKPLMSVKNIFKFINNLSVSLALASLLSGQFLTGSNLKEIRLVSFIIFWIIVHFQFSCVCHVFYPSAFFAVCLVSHIMLNNPSNSISINPNKAASLPGTSDNLYVTVLCLTYFFLFLIPWYLSFCMFAIKHACLWIILVALSWYLEISFRIYLWVRKNYHENQYLTCILTKSKLLCK